MKTKSHLVVVKIPEAIQPLDREEKYSEPLEDRLEASALGLVNGGGTATNERGIAFCYIDVELADIARGRQVIEEVLRSQGAPAGFKIIEYAPGRLLDALSDQGE